MWYGYCGQCVHCVYGGQTGQRGQCGSTENDKTVWVVRSVVIKPNKRTILTNWVIVQMNKKALYYLLCATIALVRSETPSSMNIH